MGTWFFLLIPSFSELSEGSSSKQPPLRDRNGVIGEGERAREKSECMSVHEKYIM